ARLLAGEARQNRASARNDVARKRGGELVQGALEQICEHEIGSCRPELARPFFRALSRAMSTASGSLSLARARRFSALAAAMARTPVPVPKSRIDRGRERFNTSSSAMRQPRVLA